MRYTKRKKRVTHDAYAIKVVSVVLGVACFGWLYALPSLLARPALAEDVSYLPGTVSASESFVGPTKGIIPPIVELRDRPENVKGQPTQYQKDSAAIVCLERFTGAEASQCWRDILAISYIESRWNNDAVGDGGYSFGPFQLYTRVHRHIMREQATNFRWAARWTLNRMVHYGYPADRAWSIGSHNSLTPDINAHYASLVLAASEKIK